MERIRARIPLESDDELSDDDDDEQHREFHTLPVQPGKYCCEKHETWCRERTLEHIEEQRLVPADCL
jgi:hypothetical protein